MDAVKIIRDARWRLEVGDITRERYEELIAPLRDVETVVRCRDCKLSELYTARDGNQYYYCVEHGSKWQEENDFCSYGERKDGDSNGQTE